MAPAVPMGSSSAAHAAALTAMLPAPPATWAISTRRSVGEALRQQARKDGLVPTRAAGFGPLVVRHRLG
jgi:hypothetical protein